MVNRPKVYLAGPDVFLRDAVAIGARKKAVCAEHGLEGLFPFDNEVSDHPDLPIDAVIYEANVAMMRAADVGIFNLTPFRGPSADVGTVFELGLMTGLGKPCFGYANASGGLLDRVKSAMIVTWDAQTRSWRDSADMSVEDFGNCDNLMIDSAIESSGDAIVRHAAVGDVFRDLSGFVDCLIRVRKRVPSLFGPQSAVA